MFRLKSSLKILTCGALFTLPTIHAHAQTPNLSFYPAKSWTTSESDTCTLANEFNNGFIVHLNGKDKKITSLSLDIRQGVFEMGQTYPVKLKIPGSFSKNVQALAQDSRTLVVKMTNRQDFYKALKKEHVFDFHVEDNAFRFYTSKMNNAAEGFESCLNNTSQSNMVKTTPAILETDNNVPDNAPMYLSTSNDSSVFKNRGNDKRDLEHLGISKDDIIDIERTSYSMNADFTGDDVLASELKRENAKLREELAVAIRESKQEDLSITGNNWNLEKATMMYNEADRQAQTLGQKLKRQELKCEADMRELETMLFDPKVTNEQQLSRLADLEAQLTKAEEELQMQRMRYDERIRILEDRLAAE